MGKMAIIIGCVGQPLDEQLEKTIDKTVRIAVSEYGVTDFYFGNQYEYADDAEDNEILREILHNSREVDEYIAKAVRKYRESNDLEGIKSVMLVAGWADKNFDKGLYDEVIQGYPLYAAALNYEPSADAYQLRDEYLRNNVDLIFWYSNKILIKELVEFDLIYDEKKMIFI